MKRLSLILTFYFVTSVVKAQNIDSILAEPQLVDLKMSTPQPRLGETFQISIDISHLRVNIFESLLDKVQYVDDVSSIHDGSLAMNVSALKKGKIEIEPLVFYLNRTKYTSNRLVYEVIDPLSKTDKGLWFRNVMTSDSTFCIIIEQRIAANAKTTHNSDNSTTFSTEAESTEIVKFSDDYLATSINDKGSQSSTDFGNVEINGRTKEFMNAYSVYYFKIKERSAKIKITKNSFENIPSDYKFQDIIVQ